MDYIIIDKIVYDANNWLASHEDHNITTFPKQYNHLDILTNEHIKKNNIIFFKKKDSPIFAIILRDVLQMYFYPTNYAKNNVEITINFNDDTIFVRWCGRGNDTKINRLQLDDYTFSNVGELYNIIEPLIQFGSSEKWIIANYFGVIPKLTSLQFMLDRLRKTPSDEQIIIEI